MKYEHFDELPALLDQRMITARPHPCLPLVIYNYTSKAAYLPPTEWSPALMDCRGLILDDGGHIVGRGFRKFWNLDQVRNQVPEGAFTVWEKLDGSLGIVCQYDGQRITATRGSFDSEQAHRMESILERDYRWFLPQLGLSFLFEIIYPENRIVIDYGGTERLTHIATLRLDGSDNYPTFALLYQFHNPQRYDGIANFTTINTDPRFAGQEGFVLHWPNGFRAKVKLEEYKRLHRLITQCSTRTIWEMLRDGKGMREIVDRVPADFQAWAEQQNTDLVSQHLALTTWAERTMEQAPSGTRRDFAEWAKRQQYPHLLFSLLDGKDIAPAVWKMIEPKWATPFRQDEE